MDYTSFFCLLVIILILIIVFFCFFFNDPATTVFYTLSLHDALPILIDYRNHLENYIKPQLGRWKIHDVDIVNLPTPDRKSTRLNSSHITISYAVFCLKKTTYHYPPPNTKKKSSPHTQTNLPNPHLYR